MKSKFMKRFIPMILGGVAMLVLALPMTASAHDWGHHDNGRHVGWAHQDRDFHPNWHHDWDHHEWERHENFRPAPQAFYPRPYYAPQPVAPMYAAPYAAPGYMAAPFGAAGCNEARLQNVYRYDRRTGHPAAANDVARRMRNCGGGVYSQNQYGNGYGQNSVFGPMANMFGLW